MPGILYAMSSVLKYLILKASLAAAEAQALGCLLVYQEKTRLVFFLNARRLTEDQ